MFGLPAQALGHLTSSGTIANLEALWVARELHPARRSCTPPTPTTRTGACARCSGSRRVRCRALPDGRVDLDAIEARGARRGGVGTVVLTAGTTGVGAVDEIHAALASRERYGVRLHVDAAYGGFFTLLARTGLVPEAPYRAIGGCDSVVVDPHKHGLQPYGCGAVLFADPAVGALLHARLALHVLHVGRAASRRDQPRVLARRARRPARCGSRSRRSRWCATTASARSSPPGRARPARSPTGCAPPSICDPAHAARSSTSSRTAPRRPSHVRGRRRGRSAMLHAGDGRPRRPGVPVDAAPRRRRVRRAASRRHGATRTRVRVLRSVLMKPEHEAGVDAAARAARGARRSGLTAPAVAPQALASLTATGLSTSTWPLQGTLRRLRARHHQPTSRATRPSSPTASQTSQESPRSTPT